MPNENGTLTCNVERRGTQTLRKDYILGSDRINGHGLAAKEIVE
jgi:hypothetical protein